MTHHYLCERCGGTGNQPAGRWGDAGKCDDCFGVGYLGVVTPDMREVVESEFFAALKGDPRDIMPTIVGSHPHISEWRNQKSYVRELFGKSIGGRYWVADNLLPAKEPT